MNYQLIALWSLLAIGLMFLAFNYMVYLSWNQKPFPLNGKQVGMHPYTQNWYIAFTCSQTIVLLMFVIVGLMN